MSRQRGKLVRRPTFLDQRSTYRDQGSRNRDCHVGYKRPSADSRTAARKRDKVFKACTNCALLGPKLSMGQKGCGVAVRTAGFWIVWISKGEKQLDLGVNGGEKFKDTTPV